MVSTSHSPADSAGPSQSAADKTTPSFTNGEPSSTNGKLTALQQHVLFWDRDNDGIIHPWDVYTGFRDLGFSIPFSLGSLLIPFFFSYPTTLAHSWLPDPYFRIWVRSIHKAKHGSDTGVYDHEGHVRMDRFDEMFERFDSSRVGGLSVADLWVMWNRNRLAADPAGWAFGFMEMWTTWLLMQRDGRVWRDDLLACYDGSLFWKVSEVQRMGKGWRQGYGFVEFFEGMRTAGTWRTWELKKSS